MLNKIYTLLIALGISSPVLADEALPQNSTMSSMILFGVLFVMMYFLMIRPQNKKQKEHQEFIASIQKGDEVITSGGLLGKVIHVYKDFLKVNFSDGLEVFVQKASVIRALPKGTMKSIS